MKKLIPLLLLFQVTAFGQTLRFLGYFSPTNEVVTPTNWMAHAVSIRNFTNATQAFFGGIVAPATSDGAALGTTSLMWSDLYLASGAVINFNNGDVLITHGANLLTISGGDLSLPNLTISGTITFPDNIRQTFNPGADAAGINVGSHAGDPGTPSNGDLWYSTVVNALRARINGATVSLGAGGSGTAGTMINVGNNIVGGIPVAADTTDTNYVPSKVTISAETNLLSGTVHGTNQVSGGRFIGTGTTSDSRMDVPDDDASAYAGFQANNTTTTSVNMIFPAAPFNGIPTFAASGTNFTMSPANPAKEINLQRPDYGDGAGAIPQTNTFNVSGLMHYTLSGNAETNVNWIVYEFDCPIDLDTGVEMTARFAGLSGGTDTDDYVFHLTHAQQAPGAAYVTGTSISTLPIVMTITPTTPANGDLQQSSEVTLTGWAAVLTPGRPMQVRVARLQNAQDDSWRDVQLVIKYGSTL